MFTNYYSTMVNVLILLRKWDYFWLWNGMLYFKLNLSFTLSMIISKYVQLDDMLILLFVLQLFIIAFIYFESMFLVSKSYEFFKGTIAKIKLDDTDTEPTQSSPLIWWCNPPVSYGYSCATTLKQQIPLSHYLHFGALQNVASTSQKSLRLVLFVSEVSYLFACNSPSSVATVFLSWSPDKHTNHCVAWMIMLQNHFFPRCNIPPVGQSLLITEASRSHSDTAHSVRLLWTSDQPDAETSTWQNTTDR
jgi:hypothetical protein